MLRETGSYLVNINIHGSSRGSITRRRRNFDNLRRSFRLDTASGARLKREEIKI
jgi:hypothetical protein